MTQPRRSRLNSRLISLEANQTITLSSKCAEECTNITLEQEAKALSTVNYDWLLANRTGNNAGIPNQSPMWSLRKEQVGMALPMQAQEHSYWLCEAVPALLPSTEEGEEEKLG